MWRYSARNLMAHKLRLLLTMLSIVLGVSFVVGTFIFTDSMNRSLERLLGTAPADVVVQPVDDVDTTLPGAAPPTALSMPDSIAAEVARIPGVASASGSVDQAGVAVLDDSGQPVGGVNTTHLGVSWDPSANSGRATVVDGRQPQGPDEIALDTSTAAKAGVGVGDTVRLSTPRQAEKRWTVTGIVEVGLTGGATVVIFDLPTAQQYVTGPGRVNRVLAGLAEDADAAPIVDAINARLKGPYEAITGAQAADQQQEEVADSLNSLSTFLLLFALASLAVAAFLISNTFSMLIAQRTREIALLRAIGADGVQVQKAVVAESLVMAFVAATVGILAGIGVARLLPALFGAFGVDLPTGDLDVAPRSILAAYGVGLGITLLAVWLPARRAASVRPLAALRLESSPSRRTTMGQVWFGVIMWMLAVLTAWLALINGTELAFLWVWFSGGLAITGTIALIPLFAARGFWLLGAPFRWRTGRIAVRNAGRDPRRTAAAAGAMLVGVNLMTASAIFAASFSATADEAIESAYGVDFTIGSPPAYQPFDASLYEQVAATPGVAAATYLRSTQAQKNKDPLLAFGVQPQLLEQVVHFDATAGDFTAIGSGGAAVDALTASQYGWRVGDTVPVVVRTGRTEVELVAIYERVLAFRGLITDMETAQRWGAPAGVDSAIYVQMDPDADPDQVRAELEQVTSAYPAVMVADQQQVKAGVHEQIDSLLAFVLILLGLSVLIATLGIINTMLLSTAERTREIGMLRAVGALRGQVRAMVAVESVLLGLFGALVGVVLGIAYGVVMQKAMEPQGLTALAIPWLLLLILVLAGALAGAVAALWPAWRASRMNVLRAIATE